MSARSSDPHTDRFRRALVTGGAGFIGSHLVDRLVDSGWTVRVLDDFSSGRSQNLERVRAKIDLIRADIGDRDALERAVKEVEVIFHLAAIPSVPRSIREPERTNRVNLQGTVSLLEAARRAGVKRVVLASSSAVYGDEETLPKLETLPVRPLSPYAVQKYGAELYGQLYTRIHGLETVSLRYFNVYGPRQDPQSDYAAVIPLFITSALESRPLCIFGSGEQTRDFVYVADAVQANLRAALAEGVAGSVVNVASGRRTTVSELAAAIGACVEHETRISHEPAREGDILHSWADVSVARELLGYRASVDLKEGLRLTLEFAMGEQETS